MLEKEFEKLYFKFRDNYCKNLFSNDNDKKEALSPTESYCVEAIFLLDRPTVHEFANYVNISQPNATYRISNLIEKGYVRKILSEEDRREYNLEVTEKFVNNYGIHSKFSTEFINQIHQLFTLEEIELLDSMLQRINKTLE